MISMSNINTENEEVDKIRKKLEAPFSAMDIKFRIRKKHLYRSEVEVLAYIDSRAVHKRLSDTVGFGNWEMSYRVESLHDHMRDPNKKVYNKKDKVMVPSPIDFERKFSATICKLSLYLDGRWITREGMSGMTDIEPVKGSASGSEKRAAVPFGIGSYLYETDSLFTKVSIGENAPEKHGWRREWDSDKGVFWWQIPTLPDWLRSESEKDINYGNNLLKIQTFVSDETKSSFWLEVSQMYSPDYSIATIVACRGEEIIKKLENKEFTFQKEAK
jgi:hypothetical protein